MKSLVLSLLFIILLMFFFGCSPNISEKAKIKYGMAKFKKTFGNCDSAGAACASILFEYPQIKYAISPAVKDSISRYILETFLNTYRGNNETKSLEEMADSLFKDFKDFSTKFPDSKQSWEIQGSSTVIYNENSVASLQTDIYSYLGGAHPNSQTYFVNFNSENGKKIVLEDIFKKNYENELNLVAEKIFRREKGLKLGQSLEEAGYWFVDNKFFLNENFGIKSDGLVFFFNSYEIAPYSMGPTEVFIPYRDIRNIVNPVGLLSKLVSISN